VKKIFIISIFFLFCISVAFAEFIDTPEEEGYTVFARYNLAKTGRYSLATTNFESHSTSALSISMVSAIRFYQIVISPQDAGSCMFYPSCSQFGLQSIKKYGPFWGLLMASDRLQRCNGCAINHYQWIETPAGERMYDPVEKHSIK
jgi:hypothetical protein